MQIRYIYNSPKVNHFVMSILNIPYSGNVVLCPSIGIYKEGLLIGGVVYVKIGGKINMMAASTRTDWLTKKYLKLMFSYPFKQLGVPAVYWVVDINNQKCIKLSDGVGAKRYRVDGGYIQYRMLKDECRWLNIRSHV